MFSDKTNRKILACILLATSIPTVINAEENKTWNPIEFDEVAEPEDNFTANIDIITAKLLRREQASATKGFNTKVKQPEGTTQPLSSDNAKAYIENKYPGLFKIGTKAVSPHVLKNDKYTIKYSEKFGVDPAIMRALMSQECYSGQDTTGAAWGPAQIENTLKEEFAAFGRKYFGKEFRITEDVNTDDRLNPEYSIAYACYRYSQDLAHYEGDYVKALQAYNFSKYSLNPLIKAFPNGNEWLSKRDQVAKYNGHFKRTGSMRYGDPLYVEHVLRYYNT